MMDCPYCQMNSEFLAINFHTHEQYLNVLEKVKKRAAFVVLVQIYDNQDDEIVAYANEHLHLIEKKRVNKWLGTIRGGKGAVQYTYSLDSSFWRFLKQFPSFFFNNQDDYGCDSVIETAFGQDDIAFLDKNKKPLFFTTTHEGYALLKRGL